jgi:hypothetical protein
LFSMAVRVWELVERVAVGGGAVSVRALETTVGDTPLLQVKPYVAGLSAHAKRPPLAN